MSQVTESILFRQKLYQNFKQSGLLSQLKTNLRTNLLDQLQKPQINQQNASKLENQKKKPLYLRDKFLSCIVLEYLKKSKKQYTFSILMPQSNLNQQDCLSYNQLAEVTNLASPQQPQSSFLQNLVNEWTKYRLTDISQHSTQTDYSQPLSKKLQDIQKKYLPKMDYWKLILPKQSNQPSTISQLVSQQRLNQQRQIQKKQMKLQLQLEIKSNFKNYYQQQYFNKTKELQKYYQGKLNDMKNRQKTTLQSLQRKIKQVSEKNNKINQNQLNMINQYQLKINQLQQTYKDKLKILDAKQKQFWKKQLEMKAKKRQYEDTIKLVKNKIIQQTLNN